MDNTTTNPLTTVLVFVVALAVLGAIFGFRIPFIGGLFGGD